ncbi:MAG: invasin domain 3-containing protein [Gemmatimonadota bacterium]
MTTGAAFGISGRERRGALGLGLVALCLTLVLYACEDVSVTTVEVASVGVAPAQATLVPGDTLRLSATARDASGGVLAGRSISWTSESGGVATVSSSGLVEAQAPGEAVIRASSGGASGTAVITVLAAPSIALSESEVNFTGQAGGDPASPRTLQVTNSGGGSLTGLTVQVSYEGTEPTGWLSASLQSTTAPAGLVLTANPSQLVTGSYQAEVQVSAVSASNSPATLVVRFDVGEAPPAIGLASNAIGFVWEEGQPFPGAQSIAVTNAGGGTLENLATSVRYPQGTVSGWLTASLNAGTAPTQLRLEVDPAQLQTGVYDAFVDVSAQGATNSPQEVRVRLTVGNPPPEIELTPSSIQWTTAEGSPPDPVSRTIQITNRGSGNLEGIEATVQYTGGGAPGWLNIALSGEEAPALLQLTAESSGLSPGTYQAEVTVSSPDAVNSPQSASVELQILPRVDTELSEIQADPDSLVANGESTSQITVVLRDPRGVQLPFGGQDVILSTTAGALGEVIDHGDGTHTATLTAPTSVGTGMVTATVDGQPIGDAVEVAFTAGPASPETSLLTVDPVELAADGESEATVFVTLRDAFENPLDAGGDDVEITLDGGGTLGTLVDQGDGSYTTTLTSPTTSGTATVGASVNGEELVASVTVTYAANAPGQIIKWSGDEQTGTVGEELSETLTIRVEDRFGNRVAGATVTWSPQAGSAAPTSSTTNPAGMTSTTWTLGTTAGTQTLTASVDGVGSPVVFTATAVPGPAAAIAVHSGDDQSGTVGEALEDPVEARVTDQFGNPVSGVSVSWTPADGSASPTSSTTNAQGVAATSWTLGPDAGTQTLTAAAAGQSVQFSATAESAGAAAIAVHSGNNQTGTVGTTLDNPLEARVTDQYGNPVAGVSVSWTTSDGSASPTPSTTNTQGIAATTWTLGSTPGSQSLTAAAAGQSVQFSATAEAGAAAAIAVHSGNNQTGTVGTALGQPLEARVTDSFGNPVAGVSVSWTTSNGSASPTPSTTNAQGIAATSWTLGSTPGSQSLTASAAGQSVQFSATAEAGAAAAIAVHSGNNQTGTVGTALPTALQARVTDSFGNPVAGVSVSWTPADGSVSATPTTTNAQGVAATSWTLGPDAGTQTLTAAAAGQSVQFSATAESAGAAAIAVHSGNNQTGTVGTALDNPLEARVTD